MPAHPDPPVFPKMPVFPVSVETVVQRSRFLGLVFPCRDASEARERLRSLKKEYSDATHVVHAFVCGSPGSETRGCSDDGEPSGTAGRPVLDSLRGYNAIDIFVAVIRWFGGTKLGTAGLVRAYGEAARHALFQTKWVDKVQRSTRRLSFSYADQGVVRRLLERYCAEIEKETFDERVEFTYTISTVDDENLATAIVDETRGQTVWFKIPESREAGPFGS